MRWSQEREAAAGCPLVRADAMALCYQVLLLPVIVITSHGFFTSFNPFTTRILLENDILREQNSKPLSLFVFCFAPACQMIFIQTHCTESGCDIGPEIHCLQARPCIFQAGNCTGRGSEGVNAYICRYSEKRLLRWSQDLRPCNDVHSSELMQWL